MAESSYAVQVCWIPDGSGGVYSGWKIAYRGLTLEKAGDVAAHYASRPTRRVHPGIRIVDDAGVVIHMVQQYRLRVPKAEVTS